LLNPVHITRAVRSGVRIARDPSRLDEVFNLFDAGSKLLEGSEASKRILASLKRDALGVSAFRDRPRLDVDLVQLRSLPVGTLGYEFAAHMDRLGLDPAALPKLAPSDEFNYVVAYLYDTHDVWHVVTGFSADVAGELGLQAFYLAQFPATLAAMILLAGFANTLFLNFEDRDARMTAITRGWLLGKRASSLFGVRWNDLWSTPLSEVRAQLCLDLPAVDSQLPNPALA
jgi:ubiquinone biosynthesis protein Coq4